MALTSVANNFEIRNAADIVDYVKSDDNELYVFLGKTDPWPDEESPPIAQNNIQEILRTWDTINGIRKIGVTDIVLGLREIRWESGTIYDQYEDDVDLTDKNFYVLTEQLNVYKCISSNNGTPSTVLPTHTTSDIPLETDGYKWRFMFSVTTSLLRKFIVPDFFPYNDDPNTFAPTKPGTIDNVRVDSVGSGYPADASIDNGSEIPVFIEGNGDQNSSAVVSINTSQGQITSIQDIDEPGSNYPYAPQSNIPVAIRQVSGSGVVQTSYGIAQTSPSGELTSVEVVINGSNYQDGEASIVQSSCLAYAETDSSGRVINSDVPVGREGENFTQARAIIVNDDGVGASLKPLISPIGGHGSDPANELLASFVLINLRLSGEQGFIGLDDFRSVGLIEGPKQFDSQQSDGSYLDFTDQIGDAKYTLVLDGGDNSQFTSSEMIVGQTSGAVGIQTNLFETDKIRTSLDESLSSDFSFVVGESVVGVDSGAQDTISSILEPDIEPYKGKILYINNREVIESQNEQQIETITLVLDY